jgi:hypothetical protein
LLPNQVNQLLRGSSESGLAGIVEKANLGIALEDSTGIPALRANDLASGG